MPKNTCLICANSNFSFLYKNPDRMYRREKEFSVYKCNNCSLYFLHPQPTKSVLDKHYPKQKYYSYKAEISGLSGLISKFRSYLIQHHYSPNIISKLFTLFIQEVPAMPTWQPKSSSKILDIGCGSGKTLALLKTLGWNVYGLEIDKAAVKVARERGLDNVKFGDYKKIISFPNNYFDCIRLYHVIEHLPDPRGCLRLIYKKLKPGGEVILGTPNTDSVVGKLFGKFWYNLDTPRHLFVFSKENLSKLVSDEKFSNLSITYCSSDGLGRSIVYTLNDTFNLKLDTNKFTFVFLVLYPFEWMLDKLKKGDIITLRAIKK